MKNDKVSVNPALEIQKWWAENPMTYGDDHGKAQFSGKKIDIGSREFFEKLDSEFYTWNQPLHGDRPFDRLFPFNDYPPGSKLAVD